MTLAELRKVLYSLRSLCSRRPVSIDNAMQALRLATEAISCAGDTVIRDRLKAYQSLLQKLIRLELEHPRGEAPGMMFYGKVGDDCGFNIQLAFLLILSDKVPGFDSPDMDPVIHLSVPEDFLDMIVMLDEDRKCHQVRILQ